MTGDARREHHEKPEKPWRFVRHHGKSHDYRGRAIRHPRFPRIFGVRRAHRGQYYPKFADR